VWSVDEARQFLESARAQMGIRCTRGTCCFWCSGCGEGRCSGVEDVDLEQGEALIAWQVQRVDSSLLRRQTKTPSSDAPLPLPENAAMALERHRIEESRRRLSAGEMWGDCGLVFTTRLGDPIDLRNFHRDFKLRAQKAGVRVIPVHATRRTAPASSLLSTSTPGSRCPSTGTAGSGSPWRSTPRYRPNRRAMPSTNSAATRATLQPGEQVPEQQIHRDGDDHDHCDADMLRYGKSHGEDFCDWHVD